MKESIQSMNTPHGGLSEDDIRTKVVYGWLADHGFAPSELSIEYGFEITLGRYSWKVGREDSQVIDVASRTVRPRADILVRRAGKNLLILEVKAPDEPLDNAARDQGISYARLLPDIAPFVVLTNGHDTKIFDSITMEEIAGQQIPTDHRFAKSGFHVSLDDIHLRAQALELFLSLSHDNLLVFCREQSAFRMSRLRGDKPDSCKKYIPSLYVERTAAKKRLLSLLDAAATRVAVVVGRPQVGKTNFICHFVEERISQGHLCLFYPAISLQRGLLNEVLDDFGWILHDASSAIHLLVSKLRHVLRQSDARLTLFIDGWNEAAVDVAHRIDQECARLACEEISIVVSFPTTAADRLLANAGNPSFIAEAANLGGSGGIQLIHLDPGEYVAQHHRNVVYIDKFTDAERAAAYSRYSECFHVEVPDFHIPSRDPYLISIAMRRYAQGALPECLDEPDLLEQWLRERMSSASGVGDLDLEAAVRELGRQMLEVGAPIPEDLVKRRWSLPVLQQIPMALFDRAILAAFVDETSSKVIDFYNSSDRDFVIAHWVGKWCWDKSPNGLGRNDFSTAAKTNAGKDALLWFFRQRQYLQRQLQDDGSLPRFEDPTVRWILLKAIGNMILTPQYHNYGACRAFRTQLGTEALTENSEDFTLRRPNGRRSRVQADALWPEETLDKWRADLIEIAKSDELLVARIEAVKLLAALLDEGEQIADLFPVDTSSLRDFIVGLLEACDSLPLVTDSPGFLLIEAMGRVHQNECFDEKDGSCITDVLTEVIQTDARRVIRAGAAACLGYLTPRRFLVALGKVRGDASKAEGCRDGVANALDQLEEEYYGGMCPGYLDALRGDPQAACEEYRALCDILVPVMRLPVDRTLRDAAMDLLDAIYSVGRLQTIDGVIPPNELLEPRYWPDAPGQLHFPFDSKR